MGIPTRSFKTFALFILSRIFNEPRFFNIRDWADHYPELIEVGDWTYGYPKIEFWDKKTKLKIGRYCSIAGDVVILMGGNHRTDWFTTFPFPVLLSKWKETNDIQGYPATRGDIIIGNDVWIGYGAIIVSGVKIGDGAVIGAGSIVTPKNIAENGIVPPYSIVAGNPATIIGYRFSPETIDYLLKIKWWDWSSDKIKRNIEVLCSDNFEKLKEIS